MTKNNTPLKIWAWVAAIFIVVQSFIYWHYTLNRDEKIAIKKELIHQQIEKLKNDFKNAPTEHFKIVAIGSSLFEEGLASSDELQNFTQKSISEKIQLNIISDYPDPLQQLIEEENIVAELLTIKPDLICIQTELAAIVFTGKNKIPNANHSFLYKSIQQLAHANRASLNYVRELYKTRKRDRLVQGDTLTHFPDNRLVKTYSSLDYAFDAFRILRDAGIKIVIVDVPKPQKTEQAINTEDFRHKLEDLLHNYKDKLQIDHWSYDGPLLHYKYFKDFGHLNTKGKEIYTHWFVTKLIEEKPDLWSY